MMHEQGLPCRTDLCKRLKGVFVDLRFTAWQEATELTASEQAENIQRRQTAVEQMRVIRQEMETAEFREKAFLLYCIEVMEEVLAQDDREMLEVMTDCMHNMPEVGMDEPYFRDLASFDWEIQKIRKRYGEHYFNAYLSKIEAKQKQRRTRKIMWIQTIIAVLATAGLVLWLLWRIASLQINRADAIAYGEKFAEYIFAGDFAAAEDCMENRETNGDAAGLEVLFDIAEERWGLDFQSGMAVQGIAEYDDTLSDSLYGLPWADFTMRVTAGERPVSLRLCVVEREGGFAVVYITICCGVEYINYNGDESPEELRSKVFVSHETNNG